jgi:tRNA (guanine-N7-)-methyltransferase
VMPQKPPKLRQSGEVCTATDAPHDLRSFGRRRGRKFSPRQLQLWSDLLPAVRFDVARPRDPSRLLWLEIGFGGGEHLVWQAAHNPGVDIIGCEPFEDGVVKVLAAIDDTKHENIFLHVDDARFIIRTLPVASVARAFILFPDPWPKRRHVKRRLINTSLLAELARILAPGAELRIGTDIEDYARTIFMAFADAPQFTWSATRAHCWQIRPDDWPETRYEAKAVREHRRSVYLSFRRQT